MNWERLVLLLLWGLAALACALGALAPPHLEADRTLTQQLVDLIRIASTAALVVVLLLGPGIAIRSVTKRQVALGFLPLPGLALLILAGTAAWLLADSIDPHLASFVVLAPVLALVLAGALRGGSGPLLEREEWMALLIVGTFASFVVARTIWSLGPDGELLAGQISRTLEGGFRPDSRIPFHLVQLVAHGNPPYGEIGVSYFSPYNFSSRGPLAGIATAPIVLLAGARPPISMPEQPWSPFDGQGFMAYRLAMIAFSSTALLSLWTLVRRLAGRRAARLALLLAATTPFLIHETWFTWPKLLAASLVLLAAVSLIGGHPLRAGLLVGAGYLMHPVALLSLPTLGLIALWPLVGADWRRPQVGRALLLLVGAAAFFFFWREANGVHYMQDSFIDYLTEAGAGVHATPWGEPLPWLGHRLESLGNTVVPMMLALGSGHEPAINAFGGESPPLIHVFTQYWNTLPFGIAILFFPLLLLSLARAWRLWRWPLFAAVLLPLVIFTIYWGSGVTGMLPEGLGQVWILTLCAVVAIQQRAAGYAWLRSVPVRAVLGLRAVEVFVMAVAPTLATGGLLVSARFELVDSVALAGMICSCACLAALIWREAPAPVQRARKASVANPPQPAMASMAASAE
jgi:hypothetical protein